MFKNLKTFFQPIKNIRGSYSGYFFLEILDAINPLVFAWISSMIVYGIETKNEQLAWMYIYGFMIYVVVNFTSGFFSSILRTKVGTSIKKYLEASYLRKFVNLEHTYVEKIGTGKVLDIISTGVQSYSEMHSLLISVMVEIIAMIYAFVMVAMRLPLNYFIIFTVIFSGTVFFMKKGYDVMKGARKQSKETALDIARRRTKIIMSKFEVLQNKRIGSEVSHIKGFYDILIKLWVKANKWSGLYTIGGMSLIELIRLGIFAIVGIGVIKGEFLLADYVLFVSTLSIMHKYVWNIRKFFKQRSREVVNTDKLDDFIHNTPTIKNIDLAKKFTFKKGNINIKDVTFRYDKNRKVFSNFSMNIKGGKRTALVGPSGGGKSTLIKLIAGYLRYDKGKILVDGQDIIKTNILDYYPHIGYLTQDPSVFDGTIHENLVYALDYEPSKKELDKVIKDAKCEFIYEFKEKLNTEIGERGIRLSGGQKQRLAIAKIMLKNPSIVLLDEPTSALDSFNEEQIAFALHNLFKGRTVIVVAHRLQTVKESDVIYWDNERKGLLK